MYRGLRQASWRPEDARQFLPIGVKTQIVMTANFREWKHILRLRTAINAHWEIRRVMSRLLKELKRKVPVIFDDIQEGKQK
jgi:thymidylate synthase (FAD)